METVKINNIDVFYELKYNGGGIEFKNYFVELFKNFKIPKVNKICEWCSGPGFIGFSLLEKNYCENLFLIDCNKELEECIKKTIIKNSLKTVSYFLNYKDLNNIPLSEKWNIVVSNPPHFDNKADARINLLSYKKQFYSYTTNLKSCSIEETKQDFLLTYDKDFKAHRDFFSKIGNYLEKDGVIILLENKNGSLPEDFEDMIKENNLKICKILDTKTFLYFIFITRENDIVPDWLK